MSELTCQVIEITRGTTHDGPGMRTTVFMKGCPLNCQWCQNPEGIHAGQEVWWEERKCIHCLECIQTCTAGAVYEDEHGLQRDREKCTLCGECIEDCPSQARTFTGQEWTLDKLVAEVLKDKDYYAAFGGGVTVSGGEPLNQYKFVAEFFKRLHEYGIHTALDTCGLASREAVRAVLPHSDAILFDIKLMDAALHKQYTGQSNEIILGNLLWIAEAIRTAQQEQRREGKPEKKLWIRTPLIPETTALPENITAISQFIQDNLGDVTERWELCAFNPACVSKYQKLGIPWAYEGTPLMGQRMIDAMKVAALSTGLPARQLVVSGLVAKER